MIHHASSKCSGDAVQMYRRVWAIRKILHVQPFYWTCLKTWAKRIAQINMCSRIVSSESSLLAHTKERLKAYEIFTILAVDMKQRIMVFITNMRQFILLTYRVKSGNFGQRAISDIHFQTVKIQMRRLIMSRLIWIFTVCLVFFLFQ